jgi:adenine phosphoribosyltransferase
MSEQTQPTESIEQLVTSRLRDIPDFPEPGVSFKDFTPLLSDGVALRAVVRDIAARRAGSIDLVVGIEARGFIIGAAVAYELGTGFVPVRKAGKLPGETLHVDYELEYGTATIEVHADAFVAGARVLVVDDILATGGTAVATCDLLERAGAKVVAFEAVAELGFLGGRDRLGSRAVHTMVTL